MNRAKICKFTFNLEAIDAGDSLGQFVATNTRSPDGRNRKSQTDAFP
jgi:hypothetical protein